MAVLLNSAEKNRIFQLAINDLYTVASANTERACPRHQGRLVWSHFSLFRCNTSTSFAFIRNELRYSIKNVFRHEGELSVAPQPKDRSTILMFL